MKLPRLFASALFTLLFALGCSGIAESIGNLDLSGEPPPSDAYVGIWEGPGMTVMIQSDGMMSVTQRGDNNTSVQAPAQAWRPDAVDVGIGSFITTYAINETPHEVDGRWRMVIETVMLERVGDAPPPLGQLNEAVEQEALDIEAIQVDEDALPEGDDHTL